MFELPQSAVTKWVTVGNVYFPKSVKTTCPCCGERSVLSPENHSEDAARKTMAATLTCSACDGKSYLWVLGFRRSAGFGGDGEGGCDMLAIYPRPNLQRQPIPGLQLAPPGVQNAYLEALAARNNGIWGLCLAGCRKTLEGILVSRGVEGKRLHDMLQSLATNRDVGRPIAELADLIRHCGNFGAHFDSDRDSDELTAQVAFEFIDYLMEYFYVLEAKTEGLAKLIKKADERT